jgi:hypothetical protein
MERQWMAWHCENTYGSFFPESRSLVSTLKYFHTFLLYVAHTVTINVPVVYMAQCVMILRRAISITRGIGRGWALEIETFLGPEMPTSKAICPPQNR